MSKSEGAVLPGDIDVDIEYRCVYIFISWSTWAESVSYMERVEQIEVSGDGAKLMLSFCDLGPFERLEWNAT